MPRPVNGPSLIDAAKRLVGDADQSGKMTKAEINAINTYRKSASRPTSDDILHIANELNRVVKINTKHS